MADNQIDILFNADAVDASAEVEAFHALLDGLNDIRMSVTVDVDQIATAREQVKAFEQACESANRQVIKPEVDLRGIQDAVREVEHLKATLASLSSTSANIRLDGVAEGIRKVTELKLAIDALPNRKTVTINVDVDNGAAQMAGFVDAVTTGLNSLVGLAGNLGQSLGTAGSAGQSAGGAISGGMGGASTAVDAVTKTVGVLGQAMMYSTAAMGILTAATAALGAVASVAFAGFGGAMLAAGAGVVMLTESVQGAGHELQALDHDQEMTQAQLHKTQVKLESLTSGTWTPKVGADIEVAQAKIKQLEDKATELENKRYILQIKAQFEDITKPLHDVVTKFKTEFAKAIPDIGNALKPAFATIAQAAETGIRPAIESIKKLGEGFASITQTLAPSFTQFFSAMPGLVQAGVGALQGMSNAFKMNDKDAAALFGTFNGLITKIGEFGAKLIEIGKGAIGQFSQNIGSMVDTATTMMAKLQPAIGPAMQAFTDLGNAVMNAVADSAPAITSFAGVVSKNAPDIGTMIKDVISVAGVLGESFIEMLAKCRPAFDSIAKVVTENGPGIILTFKVIGETISWLVDMVAKVTNAVTPFMSALAMVPGVSDPAAKSLDATAKAAENAGNTATVAKPNLDALTDSVKNVDPAAAAAGKSVGNANPLVDALGKASKDAAPNIDALTGAVKGADPGVKGLGDTTKTTNPVLDALGKSAEGVKAPVMTAAQAAKDLTAPVKELAPQAKALQTAMDPLAKSVKSFGTSITQAVTPTATFTKNITALQKTVQTLAVPLARTVTTFGLLQKAVQILAAPFQRVTLSFTNLLKSVQQMTAPFTRLVLQFTNLQKVMVTLPVSLQKVTTELAKWPQMVTQIVTSLNQLVLLVQQQMPVMVKVWTDAFVAMTDVVAKAMPAISKLIIDTLNATLAEAIKIGASFVSVGKAIDDGIIAGLKAGKSKVIAAAVQVALAALAAAKRALGIASPSTEFVLVGEAMGGGMAAGMLNSEQPMVDQATLTANNVATAFADEFKGQIVSQMGAENWQGNVIDHIVTAEEMLSTTGQVAGTNLATGRQMLFGTTNLEAGGLADAGTAQANLLLANMGLLGKAGSGAQMHDSHAAYIDYAKAGRMAAGAPDVSGSFDYRTPYEKWVDQPNLYANPKTGQKSEYPAVSTPDGKGGRQIVHVYLDGHEMRAVVREEVNQNNTALAASLGVQRKGAYI